jgi:hypothetical protein
MRKLTRRSLIAAAPTLFAALGLVPYARLGATRLPDMETSATRLRVWADGVLLKEGDGYVRNAGMFTVLTPAQQIRTEVGGLHMEYSSSVPVAGFHGFEIAGFDPDAQT